MYNMDIFASLWDMKNINEEYLIFLTKTVTKAFRHICSKCLELLNSAKAKSKFTACGVLVMQFHAYSEKKNT